MSAAAAPGATTPRPSSLLPETAAVIGVTVVYLAGAAAAYGLKAFYSGANADQLRWILAPTCWLAGRLSGMTFVDEAGAGFISHADHMVVGAACSGVNFLIACFAAVFFSFAHRRGGARARLSWLFVSLAIAYAATVLTNAVRVVVAARLFQLDVYGDALTPARLHRLMGTLLYCVSLVVLHVSVDRLLSAVRSSRFVDTASVESRTPWHLLQRLRFLRGPLSPFLWYVGIAVLVPLIRTVNRPADGDLAEHIVTVVGCVLLVVALKAIARTVIDRVQSKRSEA